jgi:tRNA (guanosine-2'-O-)-methyltransferase
VATLTGTQLKRLHRDWRRRTEGRLALLLDSVQTPYNVGSILRSAAAFRVDHLWLVGATESPSHPKTQKTALGSQRYVTWTVVESIDDAVAQVHDAGYRLVGVELAEGAVPLHEIDLPADVCLAVGHEDRGLSKDCLARCDDLAYLPQIGAIGSLNVATAASIALYEVRRQEWTRSPATT